MRLLVSRASYIGRQSTITLSIPGRQRMSSMKRKATEKTASPAKRARPSVPDYHLATPKLEADGSIQWPAPRCQLEKARQRIVESAKRKQRTLLVPDKDADGLSAGAILRHTLMLLGLPSELIHVHFMSKGETIHSESERKEMASYSPSSVFVLDQGSRSGPPVIDGEHDALIIDHHHATEADFPENAAYVTACTSPPVATSSLLTYLLCEPLHPGVKDRCDWLCVVGTHGDLGNTFRWEPPFPDMKECVKRYSKKILNDVVSAVNAPRRTATYDVKSAWDALSETAEPTSILINPRLRAAREEVNAEVERCTHTAPKFSPNGKVAVFRISSKAQVHPIIATRWAGHLQSNNLELVMCSNDNYLPGKVNFSCRIPRCARGNVPPIDIITSLKAYASIPPVSNISEDDLYTDDTEEKTPKTPLIDRLGHDFARGHKEASGGIVGVEEFEELMRNMQIGVKPPRKEADSTPKKQKKSAIDPGQTNNLRNYFQKASAKST